VSEIEPVSTDFAVLSLRIRHPNIDPAEITRTLGLEPRHCWKAGEARRTAQGAPLEGAYRESFWTGGVGEPDTELRGIVSTEAAVLQAVVQLRRSQRFLTRLHAEGGTTELRVEAFSDSEFSFSLSPQLLAMLARVGLSLVLDVRADSQPAAQRKAG
jgi:hypothetical protein